MVDPLGAYVGNPHGNDSGAMTWFETNMQRFTTAIGRAPTYMNAFVDHTLPWSEWASNASWTAWSWSLSAYASTKIPVVGLPMALNAEWTSTVGTKPFDEIAAGTHDAVFTGIAAAWRDHGFTLIYVRPGYEFNGTFMPWYMGGTTASVDAFKAAFQRIATVMRGVSGITVKIVWNPNMTNWTDVHTEYAYPGDAYVDVIGLDIYSPQYPRDYYDVTTGTVHATFTNWAANAANRKGYWDRGDITQWNTTGAGDMGYGLLDALAFCAARGKPFALPETGVGGNGVDNGPVDDAAFPLHLRDRIQESGMALEFACIWDITMGDGDWLFSGGAKPNATTSWQTFATYIATHEGGEPPPPATDPFAPGRLFLGTETPATATDDPAPYDIGVRFRAARNGAITKLFFYRGATNTGPSPGRIWAANGTKLADINVAMPMLVGWNEAALNPPLVIAKDTVYVASYYTPSGGYAVSRQFFGSALTRGNLTAPADTDGKNGVFFSGAGGGFPNTSFEATNYWVDIEFVPEVTLFDDTQVESWSAAEGTGIELGVRFTATKDGVVRGVRFRRSTTDAGQHIGNLWDAGGNRLATVSSNGPFLTDGWNDLLFAQPVPIGAGQTYVASYFTPNGAYGVTRPDFTTERLRGDLHVPVGSGVFAYGTSSSFPNQKFEQGETNYWVDLRYIPVLLGTAPPAAGGGNKLLRGRLNRPLRGKTGRLLLG